MKSKSFILTILAVTTTIWFLSSVNNVQTAKNRESVTYSPDKNKSIEIIQGIGINQIILNFHKSLMVGSSNVASGDFNSSQIQTRWDGNDHLIIINPLNITLKSKENTIKFFLEEVKISYE